jgi:hypothetical protein
MISFFFRFTKLAYPDAFNGLSYPRCEPMQKSDERSTRLVSRTYSFDELKKIFF